MWEDHRFSHVFLCVKKVRIWSFSGPYFSAFGLKTERYRVFRPNAEKYGPEKLQIRTLFTQSSELKELEILVVHDFSCTLLRLLVHACTTTKTCTSYDFFQKLCMTPCTLNEPSLFTKHANLSPLKKIWYNWQYSFIHYKSSICFFLE